MMTFLHKYILMERSLRLVLSIKGDLLHGEQIKFCLFYLRYLLLIRMQGFQQILAEAAQLKESQLKRERKTYEGLPDFLKAGLGFYKKYQQVRKQHFLFQYRVSFLLKEQGNKHFKSGNYSDALHRYQQALSIFRYIFSKNYQDMKDEDLQYLCFDCSCLEQSQLKKYKTHLTALYLNISSCLTKLGRKEEALMGAEQGLKIEENAKGHYKKAQAYLQDVNRDKDDIKLAIFQLKEAYNLSKDTFFIKQMHQAKKSFEKDKQKSKKWFKSMFDKDKNHQKQPQQQKVDKLEQKKANENDENGKNLMKNDELQKIRALQESEQKKLQKSKKSLAIFVQQNQQQWMQSYNLYFLNKHGSKLYSILKIDGFENQAAEYRCILAKTLQNKEHNNKVIEQWLHWLHQHPVKPISRYLQKYDLQTSWIKRQRQAIKNISQQQPTEQVRQLVQNISSQPTAKRTQQPAKVAKEKIEEKENQQKQTFNFPKIGLILAIFSIIAFLISNWSQT